MDLTDEELQQVYNAVLARVPKVTTRRDDDGKPLLHLLTCPLAEMQAPDTDTGGPVQACHCVLDNQRKRRMRNYN